MGKLAVNTLDERTRKLIRQEVKRQITSLGGGYFSVATSVSGVLVHAHDSSAHSGLTEDNHHPKLHAAQHAPGGTDPIGPNFPAVFVITGLPTSDPGIAGHFYSDGVPAPGVPRALKISGG